MSPSTPQRTSLHAACQRAAGLALALAATASVFGCGGSSEPTGIGRGPDGSGGELVIPQAPPPRTPIARKTPQEAAAEPEKVRFQDSRFVISHDLFLAADDPPTAPAREATFLKDDDEVLGFVVGGKARAYSVQAIAYHHVVNDHLGGAPLTVTY